MFADDDWEVMAAELREFLDDAEKEKELLGYVPAERRELLLNWQSRLEQQAAKLGDTQNQFHEMNRKIRSEGMAEHVAPLAPDEVPEVREVSRGRSLVVETIQRIDRLLGKD